MSSVELCMEALRLRLVAEDERCYLQVAEISEEADHWAETDPYNLLSVLGGLRYHVSAGNSLCSLHREGDEIVVEYQSGSREPVACRVSVQRFDQVLCGIFARKKQGYLA